MHILDYLEKLPNTGDGKIFHRLHSLLSTYPGIVSKIHFNTPFYTKYRWLAYVSSQKGGGVELCFVQANQFQHHVELLDFKKRKQVAGILYWNVDDIDAEIIDLLMQEALMVDERIKSRSKK